MTQGPLISVVIPVFNGEQYVKSCLENMFAQSYKNLEIIVVDDGSSDRSGQIALQYPVKLIRLDENRGLSAARNTGIDAASGSYIHFMDVDDGINLEYYQQMADAVMATQADIACGGMLNEKHSYKTWRFKKQVVYHSAKDKLKATFVGKWGYVWRYLFRLDFIKEQGLRFEEGRFIEDLTFSLPAVYHAKSLVVVPGAEYIYYHRENSIMSKKDKAHREKRRIDWSHAKAFRKEFARQHNLKIPGIDTGRFSYLLRKVFLR
ncbi:glycosyltransferase [Sphingobacterium sp. lm-10]|uniref:glycosyltransferase family 2 protein n=1 Tax=Sphingobacterium sp. lm-10 TaxID=2944904 RepID=UPI0020218AF6|nr:glycosyltransferase [Sphingobacterium sp. lm-10]MCL7988597.1 glycosyltransferase [Sphingobacterium sp. lm-10]